jgi:hypothetical protein
LAGEFLIIAGVVIFLAMLVSLALDVVARKKQNQTMAD